MRLNIRANNSTIKFTLSCQNGRAVFEIQDWGIGILPEGHSTHLLNHFIRPRMLLIF